MDRQQQALAPWPSLTSRRAAAALLQVEAALHVAVQRLAVVEVGHGGVHSSDGVRLAYSPASGPGPG
jgi:hypothetical protein